MWDLVFICSVLQINYYLPFPFSKCSENELFVKTESLLLSHVFQSVSAADAFGFPALSISGFRTHFFCHWWYHGMLVL